MTQDDPQPERAEVIEVVSLDPLSTLPYTVRTKNISGHENDGMNGDLGADGAVVEGPSPVATRPYDPGKHRERMRGVLAMSLVTILALIVVGSFAMIWPTREVTPPQANVSQQVSAQQSPSYAYVIQDRQGNTEPPGQGATVLPQGTTVAPETPLEELLTLIFTPIIGLVGAVTGFYYGGESARAKSGT